MKLKWFLRQVSLLLVIVLLVQLLPGQAIAAWAADDSSIQDSAATAEQAVEPTEPAQIICELPEKRTEYSKEFRELIKELCEDCEDETSSLVPFTENDYLTSDQKEHNAEIIYKYLSNQGWSHNAICATLRQGTVLCLGA